MSGGSDRRKIRALIFTNSFRTGGSERQAVELAKRLDRSRFEPRVACFQKDGWLLEELLDSLPQADEFRLAGFFNATALRQARAFLRLLRRERVRVVQAFDFYSNLFAIPIARLAGVPVVLGSRREDSLTKTWAQRKAERWCYRLATGVVTNAEATKDLLVRRDGLPPDRVWVIRNGVNLARFDREQSPVRAREGVVIAVVANLRPEKGHLVFLEAAQRLARRHPAARFLVVGDGPCRERIERRIWELRLTDRVRLTGPAKDVPALLRAVDIAVLPSLHESFPNAVMEAMAASLPVVATDTGGTRELVIDGHTGYVVRPGDAGALAERMGTLCDDPGARRKMGEAGRRRIIEEFTVEKMARDFERLYDRLLEAADVRGGGVTASDSLEGRA